MSHHHDSTSQRRNTIVVWYTLPDYQEDEAFNKVRIELEQLVSTLIVFNDLEQCLQYLNQVADQQFLCIAHKENVGQITSYLTHRQNLKTVYLLTKESSLECGYFAPDQQIS